MIHIVALMLFLAYLLVGMALTVIYRLTDVVVHDGKPRIIADIFFWPFWLLAMFWNWFFYRRPA